MRVLLALTLLLFACDKITALPHDDAGMAEINPETERETQEFNKLGVERDMLATKVQITKELLVEAQGQLEDAKTKEYVAAARARRDRANKEHESAVAALLRFKRQQAER